MGILKSLLAGQDDELDVEPSTPSEARRAAAEEALDRIIAERAAQQSKTATAAPAIGVARAQDSGPDVQRRKPTGFGRRPARTG